MKKGNKYLFFGLFIIIFCLIISGLLIHFINTKNEIENFETEKNDIENPSFHVLIATMGKDSIFNMLESLKRQLKEEDYLTIVFDGPGLPNVDNVRDSMSQMKCKTNLIVEEENLGYWGHAIRNKHNQLSGDFVFHVDDDDIIVPDCMDALRETCKDKNTIYVFKMDNVGDIIWKTKELIPGQIGTPMGIIPTHLNSTSEFTYNYGGDYAFYKTLENNGNRFEYIDKLIYVVRP